MMWALWWPKRRGLVGLALIIGLAVMLDAPHRCFAQGEEAVGEPKNLLIHKGMSRKDLVTLMKGYAKDLGVKCSFCHEKDYASDANEHKGMAREMIKMLAELNEKYPVFEKKATCYMCHHGQPEATFKP